MFSPVLEPPAINIFLSCKGTKYLKNSIFYLLLSENFDEANSNLTSDERNK